MMNGEIGRLLLEFIALPRKTQGKERCFMRTVSQALSLLLCKLQSSCMEHRIVFHLPYEKTEAQRCAVDLRL